MRIFRGIESSERQVIPAQSGDVSLAYTAPRDGYPGVRTLVPSAAHLSLPRGTIVSGGLSDWHAIAAVSFDFVVGEGGTWPGCSYDLFS
jgi:hypothetical protein